MACITQLLPNVTNLAFTLSSRSTSKKKLLHTHIHLCVCVGKYIYTYVNSYWIIGAEWHTVGWVTICRSICCFLDVWRDIMTLRAFLLQGPAKLLIIIWKRPTTRKWSFTSCDIRLTASSFARSRFFAFSSIWLHRGGCRNAWWQISPPAWTPSCTFIKPASLLLDWVWTLSDKLFGPAASSSSPAPIMQHALPPAGAIWIIEGVNQRDMCSAPARVNVRHRHICDCCVIDRRCAT